MKLCKKYNVPYLLVKRIEEFHEKPFWKVVRFDKLAWIIRMMEDQRVREFLGLPDKDPVYLAFKYGHLIDDLPISLVEPKTLIRVLRDREVIKNDTTVIKDGSSAAQ